MNKETMTREAVIARLKASKEKKREHLERLEKALREDYKRLTGKEAISFSVL